MGSERAITYTAENPDQGSPYVTVYGFQQRQEREGTKHCWAILRFTYQPQRMSHGHGRNPQSLRAVTGEIHQKTFCATSAAFTRAR